MLNEYFPWLLLFMTPESTDHIDLLKNARQQMQAPFSQMRQHLLLIYNVVFVVGATAYLLSEKAATGHYFPEPFLGYLYGIVGLLNLASVLYYWYWLENSRVRVWLGTQVTGGPNKRIRQFLRWSSVLSVMALSACFMLGIGNPSTDSLVGDFALGHLLIVLSAMILGRQVAISWFAIVMGILIYVSFFNLGYNYQYNYLTPAESAQYQAALKAKNPIALRRQEILRQNHLSPPRVSRYFNMWTIYIVVAALTSYFFAGLAVKMFRIIPIVARDIKTYMDVATQREISQQRKKNKLEQDQLRVQQEALTMELKNLKAQINPHFLYNTLNYLHIKSSEYSEQLAESVIMLSDIMRYSLRESIEWVRLSEEIRHMKQFIELHQLRYNNKLCINFSVEGPVKQIQIIPFLLIGLLENAFKHGNLTNPDHPLVLRIKVAGSNLHVYTCNPKNMKQRVHSGGIGLSNTRRRLELTYERFKLDVENEEETFCLTMSFDSIDLKKISPLT